VQFGTYHLLGRLASGGSAHIFLAGQRGTRGFERLVCVKTLMPERARDQEFVSNFVAEAELASHLHHPNCVSIIDLGLERGAFYISMEYIAGETLSSLLSTWTGDRPLPPQEMMSILASVCDGLHYAHELCAPDGHAYNLIHRDVSPQNIMIAYNGQIKVLDFGIAKAEIERPETKTGVVKGKVRYMSPEQILSGPLDRRSDIYSLGLVMFECLTGRMLFENCSPAQIQYKMLHERLPRVRDFLPEVDPQLDTICYTALQFEASARYPTAYVMGREIRGYLKRVGFPGGREQVAALLRERAGEKAVQRSEFIERVLNHPIEDAEIRTALGARPVLALDLFGEIPLDLQKFETFDEDATIMDPNAVSGSLVDSTIDEAENDPPAPPNLPPPVPRDSSGPSELEPVSALPFVPDSEDYSDKTRRREDSDDTRPILEREDLKRELQQQRENRESSDLERAAEDTRKVPKEAIKPPPHPGYTRRMAVFLWLFGVVVGILLGVSATYLVMR
jgi:serine/threonine protein kinase